MAFVLYDSDGVAHCTPCFSFAYFLFLCGHHLFVPCTIQVTLVPARMLAIAFIAIFAAMHLQSAKFMPQCLSSTIICEMSLD